MVFILYNMYIYKTVKHDIIISVSHQTRRFGVNHYTQLYNMKFSLMKKKKTITNM